MPNALAHRTLVCTRAGGISIRAAASDSSSRVGRQRHVLFLQGREHELLPQIAWAYVGGGNLGSGVFLSRMLRDVPGRGPQEPARCGDRSAPHRMRSTGASDFVAAGVDGLDSLHSP